MQKNVALVGKMPISSPFPFHKNKKSKCFFFPLHKMEKYLYNALVWYFLVFRKITYNNRGILIMKKLNTLLLSLASASAFAGGMGEVAAPTDLLFIEGGVSYSHAFYKDNIITPESRSAAFPNGFAIDGDDFFPNDFFGGYIGVSYYMPSWLLNARLDMYGSESYRNRTAQTYIKLGPTRFSITADKVFGDINQFSYGIGGGAVIETINDGEFVATPDPTVAPSETINKTRIDPTIEGFAMYRWANNLGIKFNIAYQIPVHSKLGNGDLNLNLGLNYAFPV